MLYGPPPGASRLLSLSVISHIKNNTSSTVATLEQPGHKPVLLLSFKRGDKRITWNSRTRMRIILPRHSATYHQNQKEKGASGPRTKFPILKPKQNEKHSTDQLKLVLKCASRCKTTHLAPLPLAPDTDT